MVENILKNRLKIEKQMMKKTALSDVQLADYFEVPLPSIKKDLKISRLEPADRSNYAVDIESLKKRRMEAIKSAIRTGADEKTVLESYGLWRMPADVKKVAKNVEIPADFPKDRAALMRKAYTLAERGISFSAAKLYLGLTVVECDFLRNQGIFELSNKGGDIEKEAVSLVNGGENPRDVSQLTGFPESELKYVARGYSVDYKRDQDKKYRKNDRSNPDKDALKEDVYQRYLSGERQQTIANSLGVDRVTIGNWIRAKKVEHIGERELTGEGVFYRRRNNADTERLLLLNSPKETTHKKISRHNAGEAEAAARRAFSMGIMHHFGYGAQKDTVNKMSVADHTRLVEEQHFNREMYVNDRKGMKDAVMFGRYEEYLDDKGALLKSEIEK